MSTSSAIPMCSPRMRYGKAPAWSVRGSRGGPGLSFRGASRIFSFAIHCSLNGHIEVEADQARGGGTCSCRARWPPESGDVARRHRPRDLHTNGWRLDVPRQAVGAADECRSRPAGPRHVSCEIAYRWMRHGGIQLSAGVTSVPRLGRFDLLAQQLQSQPLLLGCRQLVARCRERLCCLTEPCPTMRI